MDDRGKDHRARLDAKFKGESAHFLHQVPPPRHEANAGADGAVFIKPRGAHIDAQFQHLRLIENGRAHPGAGGIVNQHLSPLVMGQSDDFFDIAGTEYLIAHGEAGQGYQSDFAGVVEGFLEFEQARSIDELCTGALCGPDDAGVAAGGRHPDHRLSGFHQRQCCRQDGGGLAIEDHDRVCRRIAAQMV